MNWNRVPALAGSIALAVSVPLAWGQAGTTSSAGQTGSTGGAAQAGSPAGGAQTGVPAGTDTNASGTASGAKSGAKSGSSDKKFVEKAMKGGMAEVKLGQLATQKASSEDVKQFGQKMVDDHTKLNDQMKPIATQLGVSEPSDVPAKDKALQAKLEGLSGDAFDKAYMSAMVKDHRKDLKEFSKEASSGSNPQVKDAAQQGAQIIQQHLQMAEQVAQKVGAGSGKMGMHSKKSSSSSNTGGSSSTSPQ